MGVKASWEMATGGTKGETITHIMLPNGRVLAMVAPDVFVDMDLFCWWPRRPEWNIGEIRVDLGTGD